VRRLAPYLVTAAVAFACGGAAAASRHLVTGDLVKDRSIHAKDFSREARKALRRRRGRRGNPGPEGRRGVQGPQPPIVAFFSPGPSATATLFAAGPLTSSGTDYLRVGAIDSTPIEGDAELVIPLEVAFVRDFRARVDQVSASGTRRFGLRVNGRDSAFSCSISPGERQCVSPVDAFQSLDAGDRLSLQAVSSSAGSANAAVMLELNAY